MRSLPARAQALEFARAHAGTPLAPPGSMYSTQAWVLPSQGAAGPGQLELGKISFGELQNNEVLVEPLLVSWETEVQQAVERQPVDVCALRGEAQVVLGSSGVVRVLEPGPNVHHLREGQICLLQANYRPDRFGYMQEGGEFGYDARGTVGLLARRTKIRQSSLVPLPRNTRHSLAQWAAFGMRYVSAWANWRIAHATWRLQVSEQDQLVPHVWGWGGGTSFAELTLAQRFGARAAMIASEPEQLSLADRHGLTPVDRRRFPDIEFDERRTSERDYERRYRASEVVFLEMVADTTGGLGVSIFVDHVGARLNRPTVAALAREGVVTSAGWRAGTCIAIARSDECMRRHQYVHTYYARPEEVRAAVEFGERTGWMPPIPQDAQPWDYDQLPALVAAYGADQVGTYFPLVRVNE
jgi:NADPH:quinone reductase-like Zn-dependent oxidoreductase